jgi:hypothetical protein
VVVRYKEVDRLSNHLGSCISEDPLGARIPRRDNAIQVFADDGIVGRIDKGLEKRLLSFRFAKVITERFFRLVDLLDFSMKSLDSLWLNQLTSSTGISLEKDAVCWHVRQQNDGSGLPLSEPHRLSRRGDLMSL